MITCKDLVDFLMRYVDGELSEEEARVFDEHMGVCPSCIDYLESYKTTIQLGAKLCECDDDEVPADVPEALLQAILKARRER